jgi:uncharacterized protein YjiS (DUF1127 family)
MYNMFNRCKNVLNNNWRGNFTIPSPRLYPFQWNWDSAFIAIGHLHSTPDNALLELETLFTGQWKNGFLPHIIFHNEKKYNSYFPSADFWNSSISEYSIKHIKTSGITQPPIHGYVLQQMYDAGLDKLRIKKLLKKIIHYHEFLYNNREYQESGLTSIWHNWESGMDNSPWWDSALNRITENLLGDIALNRKDINEVEKGDLTRPKNIDYKRYIYLLNELKQNRYNNISSDYPFQIIDPVFNSILLQSNRSLITLGELYGIDTSFIKTKLKKGLSQFNEYLWDDTTHLYYPFDTLSKKQIKIHCNGSYMPIFANIPTKETASKMVMRQLNQKESYAFPSCHQKESKFESRNYWRGPIWININWMIWKGLLSYKLDKEAEEIKKQSMQLVEKYGIFEYFHPLVSAKDKSGLGGANFSWTAALIMDMLKYKTK